jgi:hypothetical protein
MDFGIFSSTESELGTDFSEENSAENFPPKNVMENDGR